MLHLTANFKFPKTSKSSRTVHKIKHFTTFSFSEMLRYISATHFCNAAPTNNVCSDSEFLVCITSKNFTKFLLGTQVELEIFLGGGAHTYGVWPPPPLSSMFACNLKFFGVGMADLWGGAWPSKFPKYYGGHSSVIYITHFFRFFDSYSPPSQ